MPPILAVPAAPGCSEPRVGALKDAFGALNALKGAFSSFTALDLRTVLAAATGLDLDPVVIFEPLTPAALAHYLRARLDRDTRRTTPSPLDRRERYKPGWR